MTTNAFADMLAQLGATPAAVETKGTKIKAMNAKEAGLLVPELTQGLLKADGTPHDGATHIEVTDKSDPDFGCVYVYRNRVKCSPEFCQFVLDNFGQANRESTPATIARYRKAMKEGNWQYVFNSVIMLVNSVGQIVSLGIEQHNGAHSMKSAIAENVTIYMDFKFGVPETQRDKVDDNKSRDTKDIVSTRTEIKNMFEIGKFVGGAIQIDKKLNASMTKSVSEAFLVVDHVRSGKSAKTGGGTAKDEVGAKLDMYATGLAKSISLIVALNSRLGGKGVKKDGTETQKDSGGLTDRAGINHLAGIMVLAACYHKADGSTEFGFDETVAMQVLDAFAKLGNTKFEDATSPMVSLRQAIDRWNGSKPRSRTDSSGMNIRFNCLRTAVLYELGGTRMNEQTAKLWDSVKADMKCDSLSGLGSNPDAKDGIVGIDDYVDQAVILAAMATGGVAPTSGVAPTPLIPEDDDK